MGHRDGLLVTRQYTTRRCRYGILTRSACLLGFVQVGLSETGPKRRCRIRDDRDWTMDSKRTSGQYSVRISARAFFGLGLEARSLSFQMLEMSLFVLSLSSAVAISEMIAHPRMNIAIGVAER